MRYFPQTLYFAHWGVFPFGSSCRPQLIDRTTTVVWNRSGLPRSQRPQGPSSSMGPPTHADEGQWLNYRKTSWRAVTAPAWIGKSSVMEKKIVPMVLTRPHVVRTHADMQCKASHNQLPTTSLLIFSLLNPKTSDIPTPYPDPPSNPTAQPLSTERRSSRGDVLSWHSNPLSYFATTTSLYRSFNFPNSYQDSNTQTTVQHQNQSRSAP